MPPFHGSRGRREAWIPLAAFCILILPWLRLVPMVPFLVKREPRSLDIASGS